VQFGALDQPADQLQRFCAQFGIRQRQMQHSEPSPDIAGPGSDAAEHRRRVRRSKLRFEFGLRASRSSEPLLQPGRAEPVGDRFDEAVELAAHRSQLQLRRNAFQFGACR
jgi:hypothetical protein